MRAVEAFGWAFAGVLILAACGEEEPMHPATGITSLDEVLASVVTQDIDDLVERTDAVNEAESGFPVVAARTVEGSCTGIPEMTDDPREALTRFVQSEPQLFGVFEGPVLAPGIETRPPRPWLEGAYWVVYETSPGRADFAARWARIQVDEAGAVVAFWEGCPRGIEAPRRDGDPLTEIALQPVERP